MESDLEEYESSSVELEDHVSISLLPEENHHRQKESRTKNLNFKLRAMFGGKAAIYGVVTALLLISVLLLAVFARPSSAFETVDEKERNSLQDVEDASKVVKEHKKETPSLRLPRHLTPIEYEVHLHPNLSTFKFSGKVKIFLYGNEAGNNITLHVGSKIHVEEPNVTVEHVRDLKTKEVVEELKVESIRRIHRGEMVLITLDRNSQLRRNECYSLFITFNSELSRGLSGFYLSTYYSPSGEKRYLATTHFEPTDARNAFPCFDEPNMKAHFTLQITREKRHVALANMPKLKTDLHGPTDDLYTDHFKKSVKMSTYLVAFVVCDFKSLESQTSKGVLVRVWAPPEQINQGEFALLEAVKVLQFYEQKFHVEYPLPKQDLIAIPDFAAGAMENWGLITYRLTSLLYDKNKSSDSNKQWVAVVVAHELAHQWFGNLVTMQWWNDLWLNEGFASFMENIGVDFTNPEWKMMDQFYLDKFQTAMALDQLSNSHPIMAEVKDPAQINSLFDTISYDKGASIIRMLEDVLGTDVFFKGLQHYLKKYSFSNAETNDLWDCLTQAVEREKGLADGIDVKRMMATWTNQMGFPVVTITRHSRTRITAEQQHFLIHPGSAAPSNAASSWIIPLTFVTQDSIKRHTVMIETRRGEFHLPPGTEYDSWIKMNAGQSGFYRVNYDKANWGRLRDQLNTNHKDLLAADRAGLLDDALNLARSDMLSDKLALDLTPYLENEREYVPWMSALNNLAYFATQFSTFDDANNGATDYYMTYKKYIYYLLKEVARELTWEEKKDEEHLKRYLRATMLHLAAEYEDAVPASEQEGHKKQSLALFDAWLTKKEPISPNLRSVVYSTGIKDADLDTWDKVFNKYLTESVPSEKRKLMYALCNSRNLAILKRLLAYSLQGDKVRSQDSVSVINSVAHNPAGRLLAWEFVKKNYSTLFTRYGKGSFDFSRLITATTAHFNTPEMKLDVDNFFANVQKGSGERAVRQSLESISANIKWITKHAPIVSQWIEQYVDKREGNNIRRTYYDDIMMMDQYGRP